MAMAWTLWTEEGCCLLGVFESRFDSDSMNQAESSCQMPRCDWRCLRGSNHEEAAGAGFAERLGGRAGAQHCALGPAVIEGIGTRGGFFPGEDYDGYT